ncbi:stress protein [Corynebacterium sphenisci DSM 44792]|uniref:Stress protein n=1 Tax=Corynebacterium sphenisci DSM 44792 TaxID=1437874 RepID=A0A1L7CYG7_9CORY|nr:universal stress protein [Corynebacterium sphenisci]APT90870.1 stress protein [Corynebacterium sphenisci DSM 44792]
MSAYQTIVVGTDGSKSSLLAVQRAAAIAAAFEARLIIGCAFYDSEKSASETLRQDSVQVLGDETAQANLAAAKEAAEAAGAGRVEAEVRSGSPVDALMALVNEHGADLLVVGNRGINSLTGRLLGSVPAEVARQSDCDVMIVHTVN